MPPLLAPDAHVEVLSPRSANLPVKQRLTMKASMPAMKPKPDEKPTNPDRIDDKWRPPITVTEPGDSAHTYVVGKKLGKGGFAVCFESRSTTSSELFALKVVKAKVEQKKMLEKFRTEMQIHAKMVNPNIVEFYRAFTLGEHTYVVLELCDNGTLTDMVKARSCLSLPEVRRFMIQICGGVKYMHKRNVIHRDLKMGNIFLDGQMNLKIGDFGLAAVMADDQDRRTTLCGTPNYIAPEILSKSGVRGHDSKVDTWAMGIICYAMLIGVPPFQSKTQQEIYSRLKNLDYEWKVDSKNYIPHEAKDLVAQCLNLTAAERPDMDDMVEHDFFKFGAIADTLDSSCLKEKPTWLLEADPRGDRVRSGSGISHDAICSQTGVGKTVAGKYRPAAGEKANMSALMEIEAENRKGCAPVTPLPEGILYRQFTEPESSRPAFSRPASVPSRPRSKKPMEEAREIISGVRPLSALPERAQSAARPFQSYAAQQRQQAANTVRTIPARALPAQEAASIEQERPLSADTNGLLKARPVRANSARSVRSNVTTATRVADTASRQEQLLRQEEQLAAVAKSRKTDQETRSNVSTRTEPTRSQIARPRSAMSRQEPEARPQSSSSNSSSDTNARPALRHPATGTTRIAKSKLPEVSVTELGRRIEDDLALTAPPRHRFTTKFKPRMIEDRDSYTSVHGTSHTHVMRSLRDLFDSLGGNTQSTGMNEPIDTTAPYPRVEKWVDYATKHGIAYLLTDGTLGMILKAREDDGIASSCVAVRHAKRHTELRARGKEQQYVPQGCSASNVEFYEQVDPVEPMRRFDVTPSKFALNIDQFGTQAAAASALLSGLRGSEAQRLKEVGLLDKFGKYMHKQMGSSDGVDTKSEEAVGHLIHFYQRLGNVGAWRFVDGGIQFNFPDHTKLVIYQGHSVLSKAETLVDAIYLEPRDAVDLAQSGLVTHEALERRDLKTFRLADIQQKNLRRTEMEIVRTNEIKEKLEWIRAVIGRWIKEGALGWTGDERLGWSGLQERRDDKKIKLQWVTVGRPGGDKVVS